MLDLPALHFQLLKLSAIVHCTTTLDDQALVQSMFPYRLSQPNEDSVLVQVVSDVGPFLFGLTRHSDAIFIELLTPTDSSSEVFVSTLSAPLLKKDIIATTLYVSSVYKFSPQSNITEENFAAAIVAACRAAVPENVRSS